MTANETKALEDAAWATYQASKEAAYQAYCNACSDANHDHKLISLAERALDESMRIADETLQAAIS